ncbi:hypothetical protein [Metaclostridioides mangenotii]|uniref:Uncharacterized protein n=1 Tax=Metaclostridioides mangenotii TaxID=1540 RepID=A0ABS4E9T9_9FIRM|nr:hypothetical protein [Clostridioides mangenotii]MBP1854676.1 hypothetical protein [Clostridioides mangenotii]
MEKTCDNCYWSISEDQCIKKLEPKNKCEEHNYECFYCNSEAEYISDDKSYCTDCLIQSFCLETNTVTHYSLDGTYLGSDDDINEVIEGIKNSGYDVKNV